MSLIIFAAAAVVVATAAIFVDRKLMENRKQKDALPEETSTPETTDTPEGATEPTGKGPGIFSRLPNPFASNKQEHAEHFQQWVSNNVEHDQMKQWLLSLSPEAIRALTAQLNEFCNDLNCDLSWLVENRLQNDPEIEQMVRNMVVSYCTACWQAAQGYTDFELFKVIDEVEQHPFSRKNRSISSKLFANLVKEELAPSVPAELFMSDEKERQEHMAQAIQQTATNNREAFKRVLRDVLAEEGDVAKHANVIQETPDTNGSQEPQQESADSEFTDGEKKKRRMFGKKAKAEPEKTEAAGDEQSPSASGVNPAVS
jgi:hypothetical protein